MLVVGAGGLTIHSSSRLDVTDNALLLDYDAASPSPLADVQTLLAGGYNGGDWLGAGGIVSSTAALDPFGFGPGFAENTALPIPYGTALNGPDFAGSDVDDTAVLVKFTWSGDVTLDGVLDFQDLSIFNGNYDSDATTGRTWTDGDLNFDGTIDFQDLSLFNGNYDPNKPRL